MFLGHADSIQVRRPPEGCVVRYDRRTPWRFLGWLESHYAARTERCEETHMQTELEPITGENGAEDSGSHIGQLCQVDAFYFSSQHCICDYL